MKWCCVRTWSETKWGKVVLAEAVTVVVITSGVDTAGAELVAASGDFTFCK